MEKILPQFEKKRVLVVGLGGGCDSISAYAFSKLLERDQPNNTYLYGNCIGNRILKEHPQIHNYIYSVPPQRVKLENKGYYGTTMIEQSLPRGPEGSPILFVIPEKCGDDPKTVTEINRNALLDDIAKFKFDLIFGIDAGGDSLTGGVDFKSDPALGRDRQMLSLLTFLKIPFYHIMIGPCCDGESSFELMSSFMSASEKYFKGSFVLDDFFFKECDPLSNMLTPFRTPNIMISVWKNQLEEIQNKKNEKVVVIPRGIKPNVPKSWLVSAFVYQWPENMSPSFLLEVRDKFDF